MILFNNQFILTLFYFKIINQNFQYFNNKNYLKNYLKNLNLIFKI